MNYSKYDEKIARSLQEQLNCTGITENAVFPKEKEKENYRPRTLIDETLEYIDPTPNIYTLFVQFNQKFFWNVLLPVQVKWSPRMTSCAGICTFHPRNKECVIALSNPLLKLRPRKDLVETLLHEMIHAYLFLTNDNRDRDGHGPIFQSHMHRINKAAGTKITIYHTFHDEVKLYQQHWWRCNGPCQKRAPYFGMVKRAMNRAPGPNDFWWREHVETCGGQYIKIKEPEKPEKKKRESKKRNSISAISKFPENNSIHNWITKSDSSVGNTQSKTNSGQSHQSQKSYQNGIKSNAVPIKSQTTSWSNTDSSNVSNITMDLKKLGNSTNNVHGWGTGGPNATSISKKKLNANEDSKRPSKINQPHLFFSGTVGGSGSGRSNLIDKYCSPSTSKLNQSSSVKTDIFKTSSEYSGTGNCVQKKTVDCPNCQKSVEEAIINDHLDRCLESANKLEVIDMTLNSKRKSEDEYSRTNKIFKKDHVSSDIECPLCSKNVKPDTFNQHLDICASNNYVDLQEDKAESLHDTSSSSVDLQSSSRVCLVCSKVLEPNETLNEHLEECVSSVFNDSNDDDITEDIKTDTNDTTNRYPCPVCMTLIDEPSMNTHLDTCLK